MTEPISGVTTAQGVFPQDIEVSIIIKVKVHNQEQLDYCNNVDFIADTNDLINGELPVEIVSINGMTIDDIRKKLQNKL